MRRFYIYGFIFYLIITFGFQTKSVWGSPSGLNLAAEKIDFGVIDDIDSAATVAKSLTMNVNYGANSLLKARRINSTRDKLILKAANAIELNEQPQTLVQLSPYKSFTVNLQLEPELIAGRKELMIRFVLYKVDGIAEIASKDLKIVFTIPAVTKLSVTPNDISLQTTPGNDEKQNQLLLQVFATCPWEIRMTADDKQDLAQKATVSWRLGTDKWNQLLKTQTIFRGGPTQNKDDDVLILLQEFLTKPSWQTDPKLYRIKLSYEISPASG